MSQDAAADSSRLQIVRLLVLAAAVLIPFRVLGHGYLPVDDALRHAAKAVSGKEWSEILVLRPDMPIDSHPGWHAFLTAVHRVTGWDTHALVVAAVVGLFAAVWLPAIVLLRRPEAWALSLLTCAVAEPRMLGRLFFGRPFLVTLAVYVATLLLLPRLQSSARWPKAAMTAIVLLLAVAVWVHPVWYLSSLPILGCVLARWWRAAFRLSACFVVGVFLGACLTGHPWQFLFQSLAHGVLTVDLAGQAESLTPELRPQSGSAVLLLTLFCLVVWASLRGRKVASILDTPAAWLVAVGWVLGWLSLRFWSDFGVPAALVLVALLFEDLLEQEVDLARLAGLLPAAAACAVCVLAVSANSEGRWRPTYRRFLPLFSPAARTALPDPGGILYSDDMEVFFQGFFRQPRAGYRYLVGFEPGLMPPDDLAIYREMVADRRNRLPELYAVWVRRMRPEDRMILETSGPGDPPQIAGLAWRFLPPAFWSGRLPEVSAQSPSP